MRWRGIENEREGDKQRGRYIEIQRKSERDIDR